MKYAPPFDSTDPNAPYVDENPLTGVIGSVVPAAAIEPGQREIVAAIEALRQTPNREILNQLAIGLVSMFSQGIPAWTPDWGYTTGSITRVDAVLYMATAANKNRPPSDTSPEWANLFASQTESGIPVGAIFPCAMEPSNAGSAKYVKLTGTQGAVDMYNNGLLGVATVTESKDIKNPLLKRKTAKATVMLQSSLLYGREIRLINTENRYLRAGTANNIAYGDAIRNIKGNIRHGAQAFDATGAFNVTGTTNNTPNSQQNDRPSWVTFDADRVVPTENETRVHTVEMEHFMRIL